ncbi:single-stranded DNA-binding protein [Cryobacterium sp. TMT1-3]|uniref:Single-stranded DNA-binding protein n=1 Tax=Cryobacterium luteum TaxID=1424661 RepID=A0A1H8IK00_9MICO|nr:MULTISPECIES: single-stranded DNA-binding protein [Cryobacterium]TFB95502.1 single-stranded DNA-binding protein [Cryobacterium luteum]TFC31349.1 single-stranded DNA-binding protein [Cryobacterium sp. TMT1-3]SEN68058.1 single-strand DNA-binding protein [Cryobacterium luteum]
MSDQITISGVIGSVPRVIFGKNGTPITTFRLASRQSHRDKATDEWIVDESCWYSVTTFRQLAANAGKSLSKGEHVVVTGRLVVRKWSNAEKSGTSVEIIADSVGHDLAWYTTTPVRSGPPARAGAYQSVAEQNGAEQSGTDQAGADLTEPEPVESADSFAAYEAEPGRIDRSGDGFVPIDSDADQDAYARLDS